MATRLPTWLKAVQLHESVAQFRLMRLERTASVGRDRLRGALGTWAVQRTAQCLITLILLAFIPALAMASDFDDFDRARQLYEGQQYGPAAQAFESLVGGEVPRLQEPVLVLESRKFLAASYLFLGRKAEAEAQFNRLLEAEPDYELLEANFPQAVVSVFREVRTRVRAQREEERRRQSEQIEAERRAREAMIAAEQARLARLTELAAEETVERRHERWIAALPFGVGQFQNGHTMLGWTFAVSEALLLSTAVVSWAIHSSLDASLDTQIPADRVAFENARTAAKITNWISMGLFTAVAIGGIVDAQLRFVPYVRETRPRPLDLGAPSDAPPASGDSDTSSEDLSSNLDVGFSLQVAF